MSEGIAWVKLLPLEIEEVTELIEPDTDVKSNETVIGEMSDGQKKLYSLACNYRISSMKEALKLLTEKGNSEAQERSVVLIEKSKALMELLWVTLMDTNNIDTDRPIGVRRGWKIVQFDPELEDKMMRMFRKLIGEDL